MNIKKYLAIIMSLFPLAVVAQNNVLEQLRSHPAYEVTLNADSTVEIYNKHHNYRYLKTIRQMPEYENTTQANLIIELDTVNFAAYESLYRRWGSIPGINEAGKYISIDANGNEHREIFIYHAYFDNQSGYPAVRIYENDLDSIFNFVYEFPNDSLNFIYDVGDVLSDGFLDVFIRNNENKIFSFKQQTNTSYINELNFIYNPFPPVYQPNNATLYDIDGDGNLEMIYFLDAGWLDSVWAGSNHVAKYNPGINNYELVYYHRPQPEWYTNGISIGDFDRDGKGNFATGSIYGKFYIYEHVDGTEYQVEFTQQLQTDNAYLTVFTEDMDGNGKPEIWIGGDFASSVYGGVTRLFAFEANALGEYQQIYQIDIRGLFSAIDGRMRYADFDGDGNKELFLTNANLSFVFKYNGNGNYYMDFVIPAPRLDSIYTTQQIEGIDAVDLDGNGVAEIIPQYFLSKGWPESWEYRSFFLKRNNLSDIEDKEPTFPKAYQLYQNYPNPFNPTTKISWQSPVNGQQTLKVYDVLGREVATLVDEYREAGSYEVEFDASNLPSGMYIYRLQSGSYSDVKKMILSK